MTLSQTIDQVSRKLRFTRDETDDLKQTILQRILESEPDHPIYTMIWREGMRIRREKRPIRVRRSQQKTETPQEDVSRAIDLEIAIRTLPPRLRRICRMLKSNSLSDVRRKMRMSGTKMSDQMQIIREHFRQYKMEEYHV